MKQQSFNIDERIDQMNMSEFDREKAKMQFHRAEAIANAVATFTSGVSKLVKPLTHRKFRTTHQH